MSQQLEPLPELVQRWIDDDPDPATRQRLQQLLDSGLEQELRERMGPQPRFGTAGVRAVMGAGRARMNCALVRRLALALAHVLERSPHQRHSICVGFDARHRSEDFAREAAGVLAARGHLVRFFDRPVPTPLLAYSSTRLDAAAGLMFTASHNAPEYNGAKLYREGGRQVLPPYADQLMQEMSSIDAVRDLKVLREDEARTLGCWENLGEAQESRYLEQILDGLQASSHPVRLAYSPLCGVGGRLAERLFAQMGVKELHTVSSQRAPDPDFPGLPEPNPEKPEAVNALLKLAREESADIALAHDPDADRLAVAITTPDGGFRLLTGDETGALLADFLLAHWSDPRPPITLSTLVSSHLLARISEQRGAHWEATLTGFKWLAARASELEAKGLGQLCFAYEEAIGFSSGRVVRDKDGLEAAALFLDLCTALRREGSDPYARLEALQRCHGLYRTRALSWSCPGEEGRERITTAMATMRTGHLQALGPLQVARVIDQRKQPEATDMVRLELQPEGYLALRPSGTEPKLKAYLEVRTDMAPDESLVLAESRADVLLDQLEGALRDLLGLDNP